MGTGNPRLLIATTVPETLESILRDQPHFLGQYFDVSLVSSPGRNVKAIGQNEGLDIFQVPMVRGISVFKDLMSVFRMAVLLRRVKPILLHSYTPKAGLVCMLAGWLCRVPIRIHTFTGLIFPTERGFRQKLLIWVDRLLCACATHVVPEGEGVRKDLQRYRITGKKLQVIGYGNIAGVDTSYFSPVAQGVTEAAARLRKSLSIAADDFLFCFVGRLNKDKGLAELISAFKGMPENVHLALVGGLDQSAPVDPVTLAAIESHSRIHQLGFLEDIRPVLRSAGALVLPSYREGFPNVVLQAGAMALPAIVSDISGCNEVIEPGYNGWLVPPRDSNALEGAMHQAIRMEHTTRREWGGRARRRVQERFERKEHWGRMLTFYRSLVTSGHGRLNIQ
jgi:glycosyltransferase involved in cell wall biosynthesis